MDNEVQKRTMKLFDGVSSHLKDTDPEWIPIVAGFFQSERKEINDILMECL